LDSADICLISQHEQMFDQALPYKIYAILAAGKPAIFIGSAQSEIAEWLVRGGAGRIVQQGDVAALVTAIRGMRSDPSARGAMGLAARRLFEDGFCSRSAARLWLELIERLLGR
jgi:glycosyltransferase involved in cell wall biosynthesis